MAIGKGGNEQDAGVIFPRKLTELFATLVFLGGNHGVVLLGPKEGVIVRRKAGQGDNSPSFIMP